MIQAVPGIRRNAVRVRKQPPSVTPDVEARAADVEVVFDAQRVYASVGDSSGEREEVAA